MNKKLLFGIMSLAALAACTNDDFDSQQQVAEGTSPIQFEVVNNDASMRASMDGDAVKFSAADGDLFTLYHGVTAAPYFTGYQNATYTSSNGEGAAVLTTPSMILPGKAIMVWPADTTFSIKSTDNLSFSIPAEQKADIENYIPYASDLIDIADEADWTAPTAAYNKAGKGRKYPVYMRTMASLLKLKADYAGTDNTLKSLYTGDDPIKPISATSVQLVTRSGGATEFTTKIPVTFTPGGTADATRWDTYVPNNAFSHITGVDRANVTVKSATLTTECVEDDNSGCKFIILPQAAMSTSDGTGVLDGGVVVNTIYGKVYIAETYPAGYPAGCKYSATDIAGAWYRYVAGSTTADEGETNPGTPVASGDYAGKYMVTSKPEFGLQQTINAFGSSTAGASKPAVQGEYIGGATTRFVKVLLTKLNMEDLHIKTDKQLRDAARVWKQMGLADVTVYLDGDATTGVFEISQTTIAKINEINASVSGKSFKVKPCNVTGEACTDIVVTGGGDIKDMTFIRVNGTTKANVVLKADENWKWNGTVKVATAATTGINQFINKGTLTNNETKVLAITDNTTPTANQLFGIPLINDGTWNVTAGTLRVQFNVTNNGKVNIAKNAQYRQDGQNAGGKKTIFTNEATDKPSRFGGDDSKIGKVENKGVFATIGGADINNYGLIEHADKDAKTYITANQTLAANSFAADADFTANFDPATSGTGNKMGRINLPFSNKEEDNISVSAALAQGFISVTVTDADAPSNGDLNASVVGGKVNYVIVNGGIQKISAVSGQVKYVEFNQPGTEIEWAVAAANYEGLMVLSPVNIKLGTAVHIWDGSTPGTGACYLGADMYVGGTFNNGAAALPSWNGYYGNTNSNFATKYITY